MNTSDVSEMWFTATPNRAGKFVGRVREFPDLKTRGFKRRLDAVADIVRVTVEHIRSLDQERARLPVGWWPVNPSTGHTDGNTTPSNTTARR